MKIKITGIIVVFVSIIVIMMFSGCISASEDINMAGSLMNSGKDRIENINLDDYSGAKITLSASKVDYEEALKIFDTIETDYDDEIKIIEINKIVIGYSLDLISSLQYYIVFLEHFDKSMAYMDSDDFTKSKSELKLANEALTDSKPFISKAKAKSLSIDMDTVSVEYKSTILENRLSIEDFDKKLSDVNGLVSGMSPFLDGIEKIYDAGDYVEREEWKNAELAFGESYSDLSKSKNILNNLKTSEFIEVSVVAIEFDVLLIDMLDELPYYEAGCRYMSEGNFYRAEKEFSKISDI